MSDSSSPLTEALQHLRATAHLSLRRVERATGGVVSNAYLSQLEQGLRPNPNPRILVALAKVYGVPPEFLFEKAGYIERPSVSKVEVAFSQVLADPNFKFGTRASGELSEEAKRMIIELYEHATGKKLLEDEDV